MKQLSTECSSVKVTLNVIGGKWKPLILYLLFDSSLRFSQLQRGIDGITQKMLTQQLRELEKDKLVSRKVFPEVPPRVEYSITSYGKTLGPIFRSMNTWGKTHRQTIKNPK